MSSKSTDFFSELSLLAADAQLTYDEQNHRLSGEKLGYSLAVTDDGTLYRVLIFTRVLPAWEKDVIARINALSQDLPKNSVSRLYVEYGYIAADLVRSCLLQENGAFLVEFLDELAALLAEFNVNNAEDCRPLPVDETVLAKPEPVAARPTKKRVKAPSEGFDRYSVRGMLGALIGALACAIIAGMVINVESDSIGYEIATWLSGELIAAVVLFDYYFLAKKVDVAGILSCSLFTLASVLGGSFIALVKTIFTVITTDPAYNGDAVSFFSITSRLGDYITGYPAITGFAFWLFIKAIILAAVASGVFYAWYYRKNPASMYHK